MVIGYWHITACWKKQVTQLCEQLPAGADFDLSQLGVIDTAGAALLSQLLGAERISHLRVIAPQLPEERRVLLETVANALSGYGQQPPTKAQSGIVEWLAMVGQSVDDFWQDAKALLGFTGLTLEGYSAVCSGRLAGG
ncbi:Uncharacterised protein [Budvicia aquatica]|uniref:STAS domain-containing protein n=1 Tax=Budvicia aquatica TaxID=82979 RepID=A0A484ZNU9_9GAMM|nr:Uncharacterised protein [Budvicia aquatica]